MNVIQEAQSTWPEDEAREIIAEYRGWLAMNDATTAERCFISEVNHMEKIFMEASDGDELITRFRQYIKQIKPTK
jgi:hypothetical protein